MAPVSPGARSAGDLVGADARESMDIRGRLADAAERESTNLAAAPDGVLHRTGREAPDRVVLPRTELAV